MKYFNGRWTATYYFLRHLRELELNAIKVCNIYYAYKKYAKLKDQYPNKIETQIRLEVALDLMRYAKLKGQFPNKIETQIRL